MEIVGFKTATKMTRKVQTCEVSKKKIKNIDKSFKNPLISSTYCSFKTTAFIQHGIDAIRM